MTAAQVTEGSGTSTHSHTLRTDATTTFSVSASGAVTETSVHDNVVETTTYVAVGTTGLYAVSANSETFIQSGAATTLLDLEPHDRLEFTISATSVVSDPLQVKSDGTTKAVTASASTTYTLLEAGYVLEVHTRGGHSSYEVYHDGNGDGIYTEVAHGSGATVDLVGLKAQITTGIDAVL